MDTPVPSGSLLLAVPRMLDPNFMHSVVLMVEHNDKGALGLCVNQRLDLHLEDLVEGHPVLDGHDFPVHSGGPVGQENLQFVHRLPLIIPNGLALGDGLFLGGELERLAEALDLGQATPSNLRFFMGYSGWGAGQLESELATGSWVRSCTGAGVCFADQGRESTRRAALRDLGEAGETLAHLPPDESWN